MAKFLKSIFQHDRRTLSYEGSVSSEEERSENPQLDGRRKLSISRSGRMKQAQKKRLSLSLDIYGGENEVQTTEKSKAIEYHVNPVTSTRESPSSSKPRRRSGESRSSADSAKVVIRSQGNQVTVVQKGTQNAIEIKTPEEEIDSAFEIIDKS